MYTTFLFILIFILTGLFFIFATRLYTRIKHKTEIKRHKNNIEVYLKKKHNLTKELMRMTKQYKVCKEEREDALENFPELSEDTPDNPEYVSETIAGRCSLTEYFTRLQESGELSKDPMFHEIKVRFLDLEININRSKEQYNRLLQEYNQKKFYKKDKELTFSEMDRSLEEMLCKNGFNGKHFPKSYFSLLPNRES